MPIDNLGQNRPVSSAYFPAQKSQVLEPGEALLKFNEIVGVLGTYEICTCFLIGITGITCAWQLMIFQFASEDIDYACTVANVSACDPNCPEVIFPGSENRSNIIQEWNFICDEAIKPKITQSVLLAGQVFGSLVFGHLADHYGRRPCLLATCVIMLVSGLVVGTTPWYWLYCLSKFFLGLSCGGQSICCLVFLVEYVHIDMREIMVVMYVFPYALGYTTLPIIAYFLPQWRQLQLTTTALGVVFLSYFWLLPESPRWLLLMGYVDRCTEVLHSSSNKGASYGQLRSIVKAAHYDLIATDVSREGTIADLFKTKNMRKYLGILGFTWFNLHFKFCGMVDYLQFLSSNKHINLAVGSFLMIVGVICAYPVVRYFTRRRSIMVTVFFCAACLLPIPFVPEEKHHFATSILSIVVIGISSVAFVIMQLFNTELFPTVLRNSAIGLTLCIGRIGCVVSPYMLQLGLKSVFYIPVLIYAALMVITGFVILLLPETKGKKLPDTIEEGENFGKAKQKTAGDADSES